MKHTMWSIKSKYGKKFRWFNCILATWSAASNTYMLLKIWLVGALDDHTYTPEECGWHAFVCLCAFKLFLNIFIVPTIFFVHFFFVRQYYIIFFLLSALHSYVMWERLGEHIFISLDRISNNEWMTEWMNEQMTLHRLSCSRLYVTWIFIEWRENISVFAVFRCTRSAISSNEFSN